MTTSYFSPSQLSETKAGASLGSGGANVGKTLKLRADEECSVKTGIACEDWWTAAWRAEIY
jgi:hypothetical protein